MKNKSNKSRVLVWDSGIGGLSILGELVGKLPCLEYVYYADVKNAPYGGKSVIQLKESVLNEMRKVIDIYRPNCVVLACNTATATVIGILRQEYPNLNIVGTEPAIRPARIYHKEILILCTPTTFANCDLIRETLAMGDKLHRVIDKNLATVIEENMFNKGYIRIYLQQLLKDYVGCEMVVVLGCTHYVLVKDIIKDILGKRAILLDSTSGVCRRVGELMNGGNCSEIDGVCGRVIIVGNTNTQKVWNILRGN